MRTLFVNFAKGESKWAVPLAILGVIYASWHTFRTNPDKNVASKAYVQLYPFVKMHPDAATKMKAPSNGVAEPNGDAQTDDASAFLKRKLAVQERKRKLKQRSK